MPAATLAMNDDPTDLPAIVRSLYRGVLRREAAEGEVRDAVDQLVAGATTVTSLLDAMIASAEFANARLAPIHDWRADPVLARFRTPAVVTMSERLEHERPLSRAAFDAAWRDRLVELDAEGGDEGNRRYGAEHLERFWETVNAITILREAAPPLPRMLDFGLSVFTAMYRRVLPDVEFVTSDRPVDAADLAFFERVSRSAGSAGHFSNDLTDPNFLTAERLAAMGTFDVVVFTEVLEHLLVHPVTLLENLRRLLRPRGQLYLTSPNFFSSHALAAIDRRRNPQHVFPRGGNTDTHHHHREPCMGELLEFVDAAGLEVTGLWFSACWDSPAVRQHIGPRVDERSNLVVTARRRDDG